MAEVACGAFRERTQRGFARAGKRRGFCQRITGRLLARIRFVSRGVRALGGPRFLVYWLKVAYGAFSGRRRHFGLTAGKKRGFCPGRVAGVHQYVALAGITCGAFSERIHGPVGCQGVFPCRFSQCG